MARLESMETPEYLVLHQYLASFLYLAEKDSMEQLVLVAQEEEEEPQEEEPQEEEPYEEEP